MNAPDAALLTLCNEYLEQHARKISLSADLDDELIMRITASALGLHELRDKIIELLPMTIEGWRARFRVAIALLGDAANDPNNDARYIRKTMRQFVWEGAVP
jgi:hypothetical protein